MMCAFGHCVAMCCDMLAKFENGQILANNTQHVATGWPNARNMLCPTCCIGMLRSFGQGFSKHDREDKSSTLAGSVQSSCANIPKFYSLSWNSGAQKYWESCSKCLSQEHNSHQGSHMGRSFCISVH